VYQLTLLTASHYRWLSSGLAVFLAVLQILFGEAAWFLFLTIIKQAEEVGQGEACPLTSHLIHPLFLDTHTFRQHFGTHGQGESLVPPHSCGGFISQGAHDESLAPPYTRGCVAVSVPHGGQGESLMTPYSRGSVLLYLRIAHSRHGTKLSSRNGKYLCGG